MTDYLYKVMIAVSMLVNVVFGGQIGQTLSARQHGLKRRGKANISCVIDLFCGREHCSRCWSYWKLRRW